MYQYQALDYSNNETRLIHLAKGQGDDPICCTLVHVSLDDKPFYHALSYCWGSTADPQTIDIEGSPMEVTKNLFLAMTALRSKTDEQILWIDALCINQQDLSDRSEQVKRMRYIYEVAAVVDVWLGQEAEGSSGAFDIVRKMAVGLYSSAQAKDLLKTSNGDANLRALVPLFQREYWKRTWVIQEFSLGKEVVVHCGSESVTRKELEAVAGMALQWGVEFASAFSGDFQGAVDSLEGRNFMPGDFDTSYPGVETSSMSLLETGGPITLRPSKGKSLYHDESGLPELLDCLIWHRFKDATNPVDKVYGLAGISLGESFLKMADYSRSVKQVYQDIVKYVVETTQKLDIICAARQGPDSANLPSWTPDWRNYEYKHRARDLYYSPQRFSAAGETLARATFSPDGSVLTARGVIIDSINSVCTPCIMEHVKDLNRAIEAFHQWHDLLVQAKGPEMEHGINFCNTIWCSSGEGLLNPLTMAGCTMASFIIILRMAIKDYELSPALKIWEVQLKDPKNANLWESMEESFEGWVRKCAERMHNKNFFYSNNGHVGMGPRNIEGGEYICLLLGCSYPVVLRYCEGHFVFVGEAYIEEYMQGEALKILKRDEAGELLEKNDKGEQIVFNFEIH
ncbi:hypothetical protein BP6252_11019 [Coleophoma cylindrospora]|uniref:Heterokaryon incompatibility domain-containing protein n=1 Tax=Coleophoma cylindrospora TaxID=1849047 RepID=A0A3D8QPU0_9HELO|nr:hypothetical protein BP6252_11019 [Coleophoma cylindrospora]